MLETKSKLPSPFRVGTQGTGRDSPYFDKFFIHRLVAAPEKPERGKSQYLHSDGTLHESAVVDGSPTGYYDTLEQAQTVLDTWFAAQQKP
ncbi:MAG: hypothetical protein NT019_01490 [Candidatus Adlerbacteria bacterium]|nr:hypothetical protein [Candidatus Adlerbacteria bacterium]